MILDNYPATVLVRMLPVRFEPNLKSEILRMVPEGGVVRVIGGPKIMDGLPWVEVEAEISPCCAWVCMLQDGDTTIK